MSFVLGFKHTITNTAMDLWTLLKILVILKYSGSNEIIKKQIQFSIVFKTSYFISPHFSEAFPNKTPPEHDVGQDFTESVMGRTMYSRFQLT